MGSAPEWMTRPACYGGRFPNDNDATMEIQPKRNRRHFQFSLRTLLIGVTLLAVPCAYVGWQAKIVREREEYLKNHDHIMVPNPFEENKPSVPWILSVLGATPVFRVIVANDADLERAVALFPEAITEFPDSHVHDYQRRLSNGLPAPPP
jgi:hypothetical protein